MMALKILGIVGLVGIGIVACGTVIIGKALSEMQPHMGKMYGDFS